MHSPAWLNAKLRKEKEAEKLSPKQIENWRKILSIEFGVFALIMSPEQIQDCRNKLQKDINSMRIKEN